MASSQYFMRFLLAALLWLLLPVAQGQTSPNLLSNPGFEGNVSPGMPDGWGTFWSRTPGAGTMAIDPAMHHSGAASLKVVHTGEKDWSVEQSAQMPVMAGDILKLSAWVRCEKAADAQISLVTRAPDGSVLDWAAGAAPMNGAPGWQFLTRTVVIPPGCATVQFRMIGTGPVTVWLDDAGLVHAGSVQSLQSHFSAFNLHNRFLTVAVEPNGLLTVQDIKTKHVWRQQSMDAGIVVTEMKRVGASSARLSLWDVADDLHLRATLSLSADAPEMAVTLAGDGPVTQMVAFPQPFISGKGACLVVPLNEGILYPADDATVSPMQLVGYSGHGLCMPWFGVTDPQSGAGVMAILGTPDDARIDIARPTESGGLVIRPMWEASRSQFGYTRKLTYVFLRTGGYVAQAKRYRQYAQATGLFKTLAQKQKVNSDVERLRGAVDVWNWDMDKVALCREMKALGMSQVLWSSGGSPSEIATINSLGFLSSRYDIYQDVWPSDAPAGLHHEGWPEDLVWLPGGDWMKGWADIQKHPDGTQTVYQGGVINSARGLARAEWEIPADLKATPYLCRFLDTTTASPFREDYNPAHPLTRSEDRHNKMALLAFCIGPMKQVVGSETGIDPSVPFVDYYEGMMSLGPYRLPDAGYDMIGYRTPTPDFLKYQVGHFYRVPLWELVYHECVAAYWYWGDATNKAPEVWPQRDLYNILYGTPPLFLFDKAGWEKNREHIVQTYKNVCPLVRRLSNDEMLSHAFLTLDHAVQRTFWRSGTRITVNFGATDYRLPGGKVVQPLSSLVEESSKTLRHR